MDLIDVHSHFATERGHVYNSPEERERARDVYRRELEVRDEAEMAADVAEVGMRSILNFGFTLDAPIEEVRGLHDYAEELITDHPESFLGLWIALDPHEGEAAVREFERCVEETDVVVGFTTMGCVVNEPLTHEMFHPFYEICVEHDLPVHVNIGYTGYGAGFRGGKGYRLRYCDPMYVDDLAARFPDLSIIVARPAWPWQSEVIASMLHKANIVGYDLHGWSPKYFDDELKHEIDHRLEDRVMFGADYPLFDPQRIVDDWRDLGYDEETLQKVFHANAERIFGELGFDF